MSLQEFRPTFAEYEERTGRKLVGLRADTRAHLDFLLISRFEGTGIGRSAFIQAAVNIVETMDEDEFQKFLTIAKTHEAVLAETCPWGQGL